MGFPSKRKPGLCLCVVQNAPRDMWAMCIVAAAFLQVRTKVQRVAMIDFDPALLVHLILQESG